MKPSASPSSHCPRLGLRERVGLLVAVLLLITGGCLAWLGYHVATRTAMENLNNQVAGIVTTMHREILHAVWPVQPYLSALARGPLPGYHSTEKRLSLLPVIQTILEKNPLLESLWIGYADGDFFLVDLMTSDAEREFFGAPPDSAVLVWSIDRHRGAIRNENLFLDASGRLLERRSAPGRLYDPRLRLWYQRAIRADGQTGTTSPDVVRPHVTGLSFAEKTPNGRAVVGGGLNLEVLSAAMRTELPTPGSELALLNPEGALLTTSNAREPTVTQMAMNLRHPEQTPIITRGLEAFKRGQRGLFTETDAEGRVWLLSLEVLNLADQVDEVMLLALPRDEILAPASVFMRQSLLVTAGLVLICVPLTWLALRRVSRPLGALATEMRNIPGHYLGKSGYLDSRVTEIQELARGLTSIQKEVQKLLHLLAALNAEPDFTRLLDTVVKETIALADADGGLVALLDREDDCFHEGQACWWGSPVDVAPYLRLDCRQPDRSLPTHQALRGNKTVHTSIQREDRRGLAGYLDPGFDDPATTRVDVVCVPLMSRHGEKLGALALFKAIKPDTETFTSQEVLFIQSLASASAIALENQHLSQTQHADGG